MEVLKKCLYFNASTHFLHIFTFHHDNDNNHLQYESKLLLVVPRKIHDNMILLFHTAKTCLVQQSYAYYGTIMNWEGARND